jgi:hypothetical protein
LGTVGKVKKIIKAPSEYLKERDEDFRTRYKTMYNLMAAPKRNKLNRLLADLPAPDPRVVIDKEIGYLRIPPEVWPDRLEPMLARCREIVAAGTEHGQREDKPQLIELRTVEDMPEFLDFILNPQMLASAADYLEDFPVLTKIVFWHSHATDQPLGNSQLYHCDHEDIRQLKIFVHVNDVYPESGPLTALPTALSREIRKKLNYTCFYKIPDEEINPLIPEGKEEMLTGPAGTTSMIDTSQVLHYGSRVASKDRYMAVFQFLSVTNLEYSPMEKFQQFPLARLVRPEHTKLERAVLTGQPQ